MLPIAYVIAMVARYNSYWVDLGLGRITVLVRSPKTNIDRIGRALHASGLQAQLSMRSFSTIMAVTASVGVFELLFGSASLADAAQLMTVIAVVVIALGGLFILPVIIGINRHRANLLITLAQKREEDAEIDPEEKIVQKLSSLKIMRPLDLILLIYSVFVIVLALLELSHQTSFIGAS